jgi:hypothetical protein
LPLTSPFTALPELLLEELLLDEDELELEELLLDEDELLEELELLELEELLLEDEELLELVLPSPTQLGAVKVPL